MVVLVSTLVGERPLRLDIELGGRSTIADVAAAVHERSKVHPAEQVYIMDGRQLLPSQPLRALAEANSGELAVHLVLRPSPSRSVGFSVRVSGSAERHHVEGLRACATVAEVRAATAARLCEAGVALPRGGFSLLLSGKLLDEDAGFIAAEYGLADGSSLLAVPSRRADAKRSAGCSFCARVKILGVPAVRVDAIGGWCVRELKDALQSEVGACWELGSALRRRCDALDVASSEVHFRASHDGNCSRKLSDDDVLPQPERGSVFFVVPAARSLDAGALQLLGDVVPQDAGALNAEHLISSALLECAVAEHERQIAAEAAQPDCKRVNGRRKQRSVKQAYSRRVGCGCRAQTRRADSARVALTQMASIE